VYVKADDASRSSLSNTSSSLRQRTHIILAHLHLALGDQLLACGPRRSDLLRPERVENSSLDEDSFRLFLRSDWAAPPPASKGRAAARLQATSTSCRWIVSRRFDPDRPIREAVSNQRLPRGPMPAVLTTERIEHLGTAVSILLGGTR